MSDFDRELEELYENWLRLSRDLIDALQRAMSTFVRQVTELWPFSDAAERTGRALEDFRRACEESRREADARRAEQLDLMRREQRRPRHPPRRAVPPPAVPTAWGMSLRAFGHR